MKRVILRPNVICVALIAGMSMVSCVDNDYDLSKDIDLNVTVGGNITLPPSSTEPYTIAQIFDLDPTSSSIKPDGEKYGLAKGDYVLVQEGTASPSSFKIDEVEIHDLSSTPNELNLSFTGVGASVSVKAPVSNLRNEIDLEDNNVNRQLVSLKEAEINMILSLNIQLSTSSNYTGSITIDEGFTISFPTGWYLSANSNDGYTTVENNALKFVRPRPISANSTLKLSVNVDKINFDEAGQGLVSPGHFVFKDAIVSNGNISISSALPAGEQASVKLMIAPSIESAKITSFTGKINPDINVASTSFTISGVPDFLKEPGNNLDMDDPRINLTVKNNSPLEVNINGLLRAFDENGNTVDVWVGDEHGTDPIFIKGNATTVICISRKGTNGAAGAVNVAVSDLTNLIKTIPDRIELTSITAKVPQDKVYTLKLTSEPYKVDFSYNAVIPLAFGQDLKLTYTASDDGWEEDLDKYNFREVVANIKVENTSPLDLIPLVMALDAAGNEINDVVATVEGSVAGGTLTSPSNSELKVTIKSKASNIGRLGGIRFEFKASSSPALVGEPLNENQAFKFVDIRLQLRGGVDIDLN